MDIQETDVFCFKTLSQFGYTTISSREVVFHSPKQLALIGFKSFMNL